MINKDFYTEKYSNSDIEIRHPLWNSFSHTSNRSIKKGTIRNAVKKAIEQTQSSTVSTEIQKTKKLTKN